MKAIFSLVLVLSAAGMVAGCAIGLGVDKLPASETGEFMDTQDQVYVARCNGGLRSKVDCVKLAKDTCEGGHQEVPNPTPESGDANTAENRKVFFKCNPVVDEEEEGMINAEGTDPDTVDIEDDGSDPESESESEPESESP